MPVTTPADLAIEQARQSAEAALKAAHDAGAAVQAAQDALASGHAEAAADAAGAATEQAANRAEIPGLGAAFRGCKLHT